MTTRPVSSSALFSASSLDASTISRSARSDETEELGVRHFSIG